MSIAFISMMNAIGLWSDLEDAFHGVNGFGGNVAELYAYRFGCQGPSYHTITDGRIAADAHSARALHDLLALFIESRPCEITVDGRSFGPWVAEQPFSHRVHVTVMTKARPLRERLHEASVLALLRHELAVAADMIEGDPAEPTTVAATAARWRELAGAGQ